MVLYDLADLYFNCVTIHAKSKMPSDKESKARLLGQKMSFARRINDCLNEDTELLKYFDIFSII